ncbi:MAG: adenylate/guanylate cyclase domain-containing protein [Tagaea sp.]|nr:adenylate/guanylate cyclase domain-containing protein [Tagaea sp.]
MGQGDARELSSTLGGGPERALAEAERAGFKLLLIGRSVVLGIALLWSSYALYLYSNPTGMALAGTMLAVGLACYRSIGTAHERGWHRYALIALDVSAMALAAIFLPLSSGGDVPVIFVFRVTGIHLFWTLIVVSALSLSPRLILFAGACAIGAVWSVFAVAVLQLPETLSWADLKPDATAEDYMALVLDPYFVGTGNRIEETATMLLATCVLALAMHRTRAVVAAHHAEAARRAQAERVFGRYVPEAVAKSLIDDPDATKPVIRRASVMFVDVERFTDYAAARDPETVLRDLGALLGAVSSEAAKRGGVVIGFGGDSVLATFGVPGELPGHEGAALDAARAVLALDTPLKVRIGIATGEVAAGTVGDALKQSYTVYGATVNRAQRLESANKTLGTRLLVDSDTAQGRDDLVPLGVRALQGFDAPVPVFGLSG